MSDTATDTTTDMSATETATEDQSIRTKSSKSSKRPSPKQKFSYKTEDGSTSEISFWPSSSQRDSNKHRKWYISQTTVGTDGEGESSGSKPTLMSLSELKSSDNKAYNKVYQKIAAGGKGKGRGGPRLRKVDKFTFDDDGKTNTITILSTGTKGDEKDRKYYVHSVDGEGDNTKSEGLSWDEITSEDQSEGLRSKVAERMRERGKEKYMYKDSTTADRKSSTASRSSRNRKGRKARNGKGE
ncbi:hypothetical protein V865_000882 [Kwoniella europaea PYCC6329]|uniref:Uncharacterized protein n=1 Tax=Kwoniella europaea PYCC6329 TaxID=1423913 RepID=A0AAX4K8Z1_9TREE